MRGTRVPDDESVDAAGGGVADAEELTRVEEAQELGLEREVDVADLDMTWLPATLNYSMIERTRRVVPYLTLGMGVVSVSSMHFGHDEVHVLDS